MSLDRSADENLRLDPVSRLSHRLSEQRAKNLAHTHSQGLPHSRALSQRFRHREFGDVPKRRPRRLLRQELQKHQAAVRQETATCSDVIGK